MYLTKGEFLQKFGILPQEFEEADISWEELLEIADDYERRRPTLEKIRKEFVAEFLQDKEKEIGLQSYHSRLKDTEHLVEKLVRKRLENYAKLCKIPENGCDKLHALCDRPDRNPGTLAVSGGLGKLP